MDGPIPDQRILDELKGLIDHAVAAGSVMPPDQVDQQIGLFRDRFGPDVLGGLDGEALLQLMHGRQNPESKCLAYWLEFKNDDEFGGYRFGGIGGGTALKFGIYQRHSDGAWITGSNTQQQTLSLQDAIARARQQRDELVAGSQVLSRLDPSDTSDEAYAKLQETMEKAASELCGDGWAHKYWYLLNPDRLDDYHSPRFQRFHLLKLLQMPPDRVGVRDATAGRFVCAGRFITIARQLQVQVTTLDTILNKRDLPIHRYWRVGTTSGSTGESQWSNMRDGGFVSLGWKDYVPDLTSLLGQERAKEQIQQWISPEYPSSASTASRKAGEILNLVQEMAENDLVVACDGGTVLGVGRVRGSYEYEGGLGFPHKRPVEWLSLDNWQMPQPEGLRTTVFELGRYPENILELERRLYYRDRTALPAEISVRPPATDVALPPLDPFTARVESILRRKGQVILYGPPGTGKTFRAREVAKELAARQAFRKTYKALTNAEAAEVEGNTQIVRICTFHPGYGYEDFVEGLRPRTVQGSMVFEPRDGIFKRLCSDATKRPERNFFLVIDEINRGDVPRIFGELMTAIELDKRDMPVILPLGNSTFIVPRNLFLIGTMNTADRSISLLDAALRRRFGFVELMPDSTLLAGRKAGSLLLGPWLDALNLRLRGCLKQNARNLQIGHAYLMPTPPITSIADFARVLRDDIIPLLEEYCYEDFHTLRDILGNELIDVEAARINEDIFKPGREEDLLQAVFFEEMQPLILANAAKEETDLLNEADHSVDDGEGDHISDAAS